MDDDGRTESPGIPAQDAKPTQTGAAERALAEAEARHAERRRAEHARPREINGRQGPEPVRYGDWENKGIAYDF